MYSHTEALHREEVSTYASAPRLETGMVAIVLHAPHKIQHSPPGETAKMRMLAQEARRYEKERDHLTGYGMTRNTNVLT